MPSERRVLFAEDLDGQKCSAPGCQCTSRDEDMVLKCRHHPHAGSLVTYRAGVLTVLCAEGGPREVLGVFALARRGDQP